MSSNFLKVVALGPIDFELTLNLTESDIRDYSIDLNKLKSIKDCEKFLQRKDIQERISLTSKNLTINTLLFINRAFKVKTFIEYIVLNNNEFTDEAKFMQGIFKNVTEQNFLFLIPYQCLESLENNLVLTIKGLNEFSRSFKFGNNYC